jgi:hypothetical protein
MVIKCYPKIMVSLLEVADLLEAEEEAETTVEEEEVPMEDEGILEAQINGVASVKRTLMKRKFVGTKASHNVIIAKGSGTCRKIAARKNSSMYHLQKQKTVKPTCSLLVKRQLKSIKMCGTWTAGVAII